jgi:16S rRNA (guanine966-N2)-methyltransferase
MRIIAGKYRGRRLKSPPSLQTRPTSDRLRETLFNILAPRIEGARLLDLCAGSGAVGIEALSRGAAHVTFVDRSRKMCALIKANLDLCHAPKDQSEVVLSEATEFLRRAIPGKSWRWDLVFYDPPYGEDYLRLLEFLGTHADQLMADEGLVVVEHHRKNDLGDVIGNLRRQRLLKQGDSALSFFEPSVR